MAEAKDKKAKDKKAKAGPKKKAGPPAEADLQESGGLAPLLRRARSG